jgi:hypothetical protein
MVDFMISVISIINNNDVAKKYLLKGLHSQTTKYELLLIDNTASVYTSGSQANNLASLEATGDYLMFIHQDVLLRSKNGLKQVEDWLSTLSKVGLAAAVGMIKPKFINQYEAYARYLSLLRLGLLHLWFLRYGRGNNLHGSSMSPWGGRFVTSPVCVQTVDEFFLTIPASIFEHTKFDEVTCSDWHLFGTDYSLSIQQKGYKVYVLPISVIHRSKGTISIPYVRTLAKVLEKHKNEKVVNTPWGLYPTSLPFRKLCAKIGDMIGWPYGREVSRSNVLYRENA